MPRNQSVGHIYRDPRDGSIFILYKASKAYVWTDNKYEGTIDLSEDELNSLERMF